MQGVSLSRLKTRLLADPTLIDVRAAALRVIRARKKCSAAMAQWWLIQIEGVDQMGALLRKVLPEAEWSRLARLRPGTDLCEVVGFPFYHDMMLENLEEMHDEGYRLEYEDIPIVGLNPRNGGSYPDEMGLLFKVADLLNRPEHAYTERAHTSFDDHIWAELQRDYDLPSGLRPTGSVSDVFFAWVFENQRNPLRHFPLALRVGDYSTGSVFYDYDPEMGETGIDWTRENVVWLREQYRLAQRIRSKLNNLHRWLDADPAARISTACRLYRKAQNLTRDEKRRVKIDVAAGTAGRALVTIL